MTSGPGASGLLDGRRVVRGFVRLAGFLAESATIDTRMGHLCEQTAQLLDCDRVSLFIRDGDLVRAAYNFGNPPDVAAGFPDFYVKLGTPLMRELFDSPSYVVVDDARTDRRIGPVAETARIESMVFAPIFDPAGEPFGFLTAEYNERLDRFDEIQAEVVLGAAYLAGGAVLAEQERAELVVAEARREQLLSELVSAEERTRRNITADIHDDPLQVLMALLHQLDLMASKTEDRDERAQMAGLVDLCEQTVRSLRGSLRTISPSELVSGTLAEAVEAVAGRLAEAAGWTLGVSCDFAAEPSREEATLAYRIASQALQNVHAHAEADEVRVEMSDRGGVLRVEVVDDGCGFDRAMVPPDRFGITGMMNRAEYAGGCCEVMSAPGAGTIVRVELPLAGSASSGSDRDQSGA